MTADEIAYERWRELEGRRRCAEGAAHYFHIDERTAIQWCWLQWQARAEAKQAEREAVTH